MSAFSLRSRRKHKAWGGARLCRAQPQDLEAMEFQAHEMGGSPYAANLVGIFAAFVLSPAFAGLKICRAWILGLRSQSLAPPQALCCTPAPQAKQTVNGFACALSTSNDPSRPSTQHRSRVALPHYRSHPPATKPPSRQRRSLHRQLSLPHPNDERYPPDRSSPVLQTDPDTTSLQTLQSHLD